MLISTRFAGPLLDRNPVLKFDYRIWKAETGWIRFMTREEEWYRDHFFPKWVTHILNHYPILVDMRDRLLNEIREGEDYLRIVMLLVDNGARLQLFLTGPEEIGQIYKHQTNPELRAYLWFLYHYEGAGLPIQLTNRAFKDPAACISVESGVVSRSEDLEIILGRENPAETWRSDCRRRKREGPSLNCSR